VDHTRQQTTVQARPSGDSDPKHVSTIYVERQNLTMRMGVRWFTSELPQRWLPRP